MSKLRIFMSSSLNPWFNIATEEWIFREMDPTVQTLYLWQNDNTVVIGRNQNPWTECNLPKMEADGVMLARRMSGGGAVYHDLGNTCFTFLSPREGYNRATNSAIILKALEKFGVKGEASGRNDLIVKDEDGEKKFSGSAFRETRDRAFHHGTVLMSVDLSKLAQYLTPHPKKMLSKGRTSVRARVMNLNEIAPSINHGTLCPAIIEAFCEHYGATAEVEHLTPENLAHLPGLQQRFEELKSWEWRFGHSPNFQQQLTEYLSWGFVDVFLDSEHGKISRVEVYSDSLFPQLIDVLQKSLEGQTYSKSGIEAAAFVARESLPEHLHEIAEFEAWMRSQIEI
jgi:lipoate---protein ligase